MRARRTRKMPAQGVHDVAQVAPRVLPAVLEIEALRDVAQRLPQAIDQGVIAGIRRRVAFEVLGGDRRAPEDELIVVMAPVQHRARDRVVEGLGALGLLVLVQQADVGQLDRRPERLVARLREALEQLADPLFHALVVHLDAVSREAAHFEPCRALEQRLRLYRSFAEQAVMPVEAIEDAAREVLRQARAPLARCNKGREAAHTAASLAFFLSSKNCSSSVEPCSAVVDAVPPVTTCVISSK